jgi:amidophosphoribosyltransferase
LSAPVEIRHELIEKLQEVDQYGNVIPSDQTEPTEAAPVNGTSKMEAAADPLGTANGHSDEKRPSQSQDISLHNFNDFN